MPNGGKLSNYDVSVSKKFLERFIHGNYDFSKSPHLKETPRRFAKMIMDLTTAEEFEFTTFKNDNNRGEMVIIKDIPFTALCAHHIVPFMGVCHVGYIPTDTIAGLSKFARAVKYWAAGLWTQEDLTNTISGYFEDMLDPLGVGVVMQAEHLCMTIRGVQTPGSKTITSSMRGVFLDKPAARAEFLNLIGKNNV